MAVPNLIMIGRPYHLYFNPQSLSIYKPVESVLPETYRNVNVKIADKPGRDKRRVQTRAGYIVPKK